MEINTMSKVSRENIVVKKEGGLRNGKGFSLTELKEAGLKLSDAKNKKIAVDKRRKSCHTENIEALKSL